MNHQIYVCDTETDGLDYQNNSIIELSIIRLSDNTQKTWCLKSANIPAIQKDALRINGHKYEDITHQTKEGKEKYLEPSKVIVEIENWLMEDDCTANNRVIAGQNIRFDMNFLEKLWERCESSESYPFGRRSLDTGMIEFFQDMVKGEYLEGYSLKNLCKKYNLTNLKAHSASADTLVTKDILKAQIESFKIILNNEKKN